MIWSMGKLCAHEYALSDKGPKKLAQQMQQKGLKPEIIEQALSQYTFEDQVQNAHQTAEKRLEKSRKSQKNY